MLAVARAERVDCVGADDGLDALAAAPGRSSSYSSERRLRARKSVLSTAGRLSPMRSPIST